MSSPAQWEQRIHGSAAGEARVLGTTISVRAILRALAQGQTVTELLRQHPELKEADILACLAFAADRLREEVSDQSSLPSMAHGGSDDGSWRGRNLYIANLDKPLDTEKLQGP